MNKILRAIRNNLKFKWAWVKIIAINATIFLALIGGLLLLPPTAFLAQKILKNMIGYDIKPLSTTDPRVMPPNYKNIDWAETHFKELGKLPSEYKDYIVSRRTNFAGETVNIIDGIRVTHQADNIVDNNKEAWFLGGSTIWGHGSNDANTIPSIFAKQTAIETTNLGEAGYNARQSLAFLTNQYITHPSKATKKIIIFYDGGNDVFYRCNKLSEGLSTLSQARIQKSLKYTKIVDNYDFRFRALFFQFNDFINFLQHEPPIIRTNAPIRYSQNVGCDESPERMQEIAETLVATWQQAQYLAASNGDDFLAILQPAANLSKTKKDHLPQHKYSRWNDAEVTRQYRVIYALIRAEAKRKNINFVDLSDAYDVDDYIYIDWVHVSPNAHEILVPKIINALKEQNLL
ncbi:MAG: hypothetical protein K0U45_00575 [Alphaproteobacteria bacterium]|nr:hypothetical protein [Alphaproteobacteria bacterium]